MPPDKQSENDVKTLDERYRLLVDSVEDYAIFLLDTEGRVSTWNEGARRTKGYAAHEIIGESMERFYTEEDRAEGRPGKLLKRAAARVGMNVDPLGGHSLRAGCVTQAAMNGVREFVIMKQTGHKTEKTLRRYIRNGELFRENAAAAIGI